ncbi:MAG: MarR family transcriptional regulator [Trueperaceae bacterium]|nr:MarR family transcriptional regulator [Trueperaceae bacterium]
MTELDSRQVLAVKSAWGLEHEVFLKLVKVVNELSYEIEVLLKEQGLSSAHYNILRILRGAGEEGLACSAIGERLLVKSPDITRLLDRLEKQELIERARSLVDRRIVTSCLSEKGQKLLAALDEPMKQLHKKQLEHLGETKLEQLSKLLDDIQN